MRLGSVIREGKMACTSIRITSSATSPATTADIAGMRRSESAKDLRCDRGTKIRRSRSEPQLKCSLNVPRAALTTKSKSIGKFPFNFAIPKILSDYDEASSRSSLGLIDQDREDADDNALMKRGNWVERILELRSKWRSRKEKEEEEVNGDGDFYCGVSYESDEEEKTEVEDEEWDSVKFGRLLTRVSWSETKMMAKLAFLCNMAYAIPEIKAEDLRTSYGLQLVTSSLQKKSMAAVKSHPGPTGSGPKPEHKSPVDPHLAYGIAASAASYVRSRARGLLSFGGGGGGSGPHEAGTEEARGEVAAFVAASTMTAVVAAEEEARLEAAKGLRSLHSSPCEWFVCDDPGTCTRCFVIQGSDSLASWQANLMFDPTNFEGTEVLVHRGIYEAAKGIYDQFMPEIKTHLKRYGNQAKFRFTGHSLGGSLSLLVNLMLCARNAVPLSSLLPVVTFGSPSVFCGGKRVVDALGLDEGHILSVMLHRDIVPRAFSCSYPHHVAQLLKRLNGSFRSHPCLSGEKLLYSPLGKFLILQPNEKLSPPHPLLPPGPALYSLDKNHITTHARAIKAFLNSPHPLETLSSPSAYGSEGTIIRDHDSSNYLKAINGLIKQHTSAYVMRPKKQRLSYLWPLSLEKPVLVKEVAST